MGINLYDHQREAVNKLKSGSILCGGVGSGKSRTALAYYFFKVCHGRVSVNDRSGLCEMQSPLDLYIITTARKRDTYEWELECAPFGIPNDEVKVTIDSWNNIKKYTGVHGSFFIFDEQRVVGWGAWSKAFLKITKSNQWILLSATPGDTWMDYIPVFVANGFYRGKTEFVNRHVIYNKYAKYPMVDRFIDQGYLERCRRKILVDMKFERPTISHNDNIMVEYDKAQYHTIMKERWNPYDNKPIQNVSELCFLLRRTINSDPSRAQAMVRLSHKHDKLIVFYNHNYELDILKHLDYGDGCVVAEWNGHQHEPIPKSERWVYLVQYAAGAEGWNCVETDAMVFYSQTYSYKTLAQASGRIDRLNTPFIDLYYYHIRSSAPIDLAIYKALKRKKKFNESSFIGE